MLQAVIFDLDGVLIDSTSSALSVRTRVLAEYGVEFNKLPDPHGENHKGSSMKDLLSIVHKHYPDVSFDEAQFTQKVVAGVTEDLKDRGVTAEPDLIRLLDQLKEHGVPCAVATAGLSRSVDDKLNILGIKHYFQVIVTADDVTEHKPNPASYLLAIQKLGVHPAGCIVFEDSTPGVEAGVAAGCKVVGFTKYSSSKQLSLTTKNINEWNEIGYMKLTEL